MGGTIQALSRSSEPAGVKLALTLPGQHPAHVAFDVGSAPPESFFKGAKTHRDGSVSKYTSDLDGNAITDAGLDHLQNLNKLESLSLYGTPVTNGGIKAIQGFLPRTGITH